MKKSLPLFRHRYWMLIACLMCAGLINAQQINPASESGDSNAEMSVSEPVSQDETVNKINKGIVSMYDVLDNSLPHDADDDSQRKAPARKTNVNGSVNASSLMANDNIVLTGNTTLNMDADLALTSIRGDYSLNIQGSHKLTVKNPSGVAIRVRSLNSTAPLYLTAKYEAITTKTTDKYEGDITIKAPLYARTTSENDYCIIGNNITLDAGGDGGNDIIEVWSVYTSVCSFGDMTLDHYVSATASGTQYNVPAIAVLNGGNLLIKEHGSIFAFAKGYGVYAHGNITMEGGKLNVNAPGNMDFGPTKLNGIVSTGGNVSLTGNVEVESEYPAITGTDVTINGSLTAETTEEEFYCIVGRNKITLNGEYINNVSSTKYNCL